MPLLTVTIPTKDRPALLQGAVESVLQQTRDAEVIVVDDGSSPSNSAEIRRLCNSDGRIRLISNPTSMGAPHGRNQGLAAADGRYWATLDDDDRWLPGKWQAQHAVLEKHGFPSDLVVTCGIQVSRDDLQPLRHMPTLDRPQRFSTLSSLLHALPVRAFLNTYVAPTALMRSIGGYDERLIWGEHTDLLIRLMGISLFAAAEHEGVVVDRWHEAAASRTGRNWTLKVAGLKLILDKHASVFQREPELLQSYRHVLGISQLRAGDRKGAVATLASIATQGRGIRPRVRAAMHLAVAAAGGPGLWAALERRRASSDGRAADAVHDG